MVVVVVVMLVVVVVGGCSHPHVDGGCRVEVVVVMLVLVVVVIVVVVVVGCLHGGCGSGPSGMVSRVQMWLTRESTHHREGAKGRRRRQGRNTAHHGSHSCPEEVKDTNLEN